jgi:tetratricopeptide (TPR) repeat protein
LIGLLYIVIFGGLAFLRREGLSLQFALEVIVVTVLVAGASLLIGFSIHPVIFLIVVYLITMRARLLVDLGNLLAGRGNRRPADALYRLALQFKPDATARQIVRLNQAVHLLQQRETNQTIAILEDLLTGAEGDLSPKHKAAARFNLGAAYRRQGQEARATAEFNRVLDLMPGSVYAANAQAALEKGRRKGESSDPDAETR